MAERSLAGTGWLFSSIGEKSSLATAEESADLGFYRGSGWKGNLLLEPFILTVIACLG